MSALLLLAALVASPIVGGGFGELGNAIPQILVFAAIIVHLFSASGTNPRRSGESWVRAPGSTALAVLVLIVAVSAIFTEAVYPTLRQLFFVLACVGAYMLAAALGRDPKVVAAFVWGVVLSALGICAIGVRQYAISAGGGAKFWQSLLTTGEQMRLFGPFVNPGFFAGYLVIAIPVTLGVYLVTRRSVLALLAGFAFVIEILALMLTGTKFGIVSAVAALIVLFALAIATKSLKRSRFRRLFVIAVVLIPLLVVFSSPVRSRIVAAESGGTQVHSTVFRVMTWQGTLDMIRHNLWIGVGPGAYDIAFPRYEIAGYTTYAHDSYLQLAAESGVVALGALVVALIAIGSAVLTTMSKGHNEPQDKPHKPLEMASSKSSISWTDFVPFSGWRMLNCAIFSALMGSVIRNLVDSDWYMIGIALPFWILAGALVAQAGATGRVSFAPGRWAKAAVVLVCTIGVLLNTSFGLGNLFEPDYMARVPADQYESALHRYETASTISPLNPRLHVELAKYLAFVGNDPDRADCEIQTAIRLAPTYAGGYHIRGIMALRTGNSKSAIRYFRKALKLNPNSTQTLYHLAQTYRMLGDMGRFEATLTRLEDIENSEYEQVKGVPELVDTTYADAHAYFGGKYLARRKYASAAGEFISAVDRLERWRSNKQMIEVARHTGRLTKEEETQLLTLLRDCYLGLAKACRGMGNATGAREALAKAKKVGI